jgi:hypothetical protein
MDSATMGPAHGHDAEECRMVDEHNPGSADNEAPASEEQSLLPIAVDAPLMIGLPVVAADGEVLGTVDEDVAGRFKVAAPMAADYWLPKQLIAGMAPGGDLIVSVDRHTLDAAKVAEPDNP